jgi:hypothetical protein
MSASTEFPLKVIAQIHGVSVRQARRWCADGIIKNAYQDTKGHWHIPRLTPEETNIVIRNVIDEILHDFKSWFCPSFNEVLEAVHVIAGFPDVGFAEFDPVSKSYRWRYKIPQGLLHKILDRDPLSMLRVKVQLLYQRGYRNRYGAVSPGDLATILGFKSVQTLYNRYGQEIVRKACKTPAVL